MSIWSLSVLIPKNPITKTKMEHVANWYKLTMAGIGYDIIAFLLMTNIIEEHSE